MGPDENDPSKGEVVLWQIDAHPGQPLDRVNVGETPPGFTVVVPAHLPLPSAADLDLTVESGVEGDAYFRLSELRPGRVNWEGRQVSFKSFRHGAYYGGKCASEPLPIGLSLGALGFAVTAAAMLVFFLVRWNRRRRRNPPPAWHPDPWGEGRLRWWDGREWSGYVYPEAT